MMTHFAHIPKYRTFSLKLNFLSAIVILGENIQYSIEVTLHQEINALNM